MKINPAINQLISYLISVFHLKLGGSRCLVLSMLPPWSSCNGGGEEGGGGAGEQQASCLVAKQAVEFPQVLTSTCIIMSLTNSSP